MAFTSATIVASYLDADGTPASGEVEFTLSTTMENAGVTLLAGTSVVTTLDASGNLSQSLVSTGDVGTTSDGLLSWRVDERLSNAETRTTYVQVPPGGETVALSSLSPPPAFG